MAATTRNPIRSNANEGSIALLLPTRVRRNAFVEPRSRQIELFGCLLDGEGHNADSDDPGVDILGALPPIELKQNRAASVYGDLAQHMSVEQVLAHDSKGLFELRAIEAFAADHECPMPRRPCRGNEPSPL